MWKNSFSNKLEERKMVDPIIIQELSVYNPVVADMSLEELFQFVEMLYSTEKLNETEYERYQILISGGLE
jgi:hypothetical protein